MNRDPYFALFNSLQYAIEAIDKGNPQAAREILVKAHQEGEELWIENQPINVSDGIA